MAYVVAVDAGGTATRAVVADVEGRCLGYALAGGGNPVSAGAEAAMIAFRDGLERALGQAGVAGDEVELVLLAMAGDVVGDRAGELSRLLRHLGLTAPAVVEGDLLGAYCSGAPELDGYCLEAGTGSGAIRVEGGRLAASADGLGWLLGDEGSGFWIGRRALAAGLADLDGRGPATGLTTLVLAELGLPDDRRPGEHGRPAVIDQGLRLVYADPPVALARFARLVFELADDPVAQSIRQAAGRRLAATLGALVVPQVAGPVVLAGSVLTRQPELAAQVSRAGAAGFARPPEYRLVADGAVGAVVLALRRLGRPVDRAVFERVAATLGALPGRR